MKQTMRAVVVDGRGGIALVEKGLPEPGPTDVVIAPRASGVCGTDLHLLDGTYTSGRYPVTPGHEFAGIVTRTGRDVTRVSEGDLVCVDPNITCGRCRWCRTGALNHCTDLDPLGISRDGSWADYVAAPESVVHRLPSGVDAGVGALVEPLSCVLHAASRTPGWAGSHVAVLGAGPIGLIAVAVARHLGAGRVVIFEPQARRRELALTLGADAAYSYAAGLGAPDGFDIAVEASGHPSAIRSAIGALAPRGRLLQMGVANPDVRIEVSPHEVFAKELMLIGSFSVADAYPDAVALVPDLADTLRPLLTEQVPLSRCAQVVDRVRAPENVKVLVVPD